MRKIPNSISPTLPIPLNNKTTTKKVLRNEDPPNLQPTRAILIPKEQRKMDRTLIWFENKLKDIKSYLSEYMSNTSSPDRQSYLNAKTITTISSTLAVNDWIRSEFKNSLVLKDQPLLDDTSREYFETVLNQYSNTSQNGIKNYNLLGELEETKLDAAILNVSTYHLLYQEKQRELFSKIAFQNTEASIQNREQIDALRNHLSHLQNEERLKMYEIQTLWKKERQEKGYAFLSSVSNRI